MKKKGPERGRDVGRDSREWHRRRVEKAFELAKKMKQAKWKKQQLAGKTIDDLEKKHGIGELANYLLKMETKKLDKLIEEDLRKLQEGATTKAQSAKKGLGSSIGSKVKSLSEGFTNYMEQKKDSTGQEKPEKSTAKKSTTDNPQRSFKNVMKDARKLRTQRDTGRDTKTPKDKKFKIETSPDGSIKNIDSLIKKLQAEIPIGTKRTSHLELDLDGLSPGKVQKLKQSLQDNKTNFEKKISDQFHKMNPNEEVRVGVVDNRVYLWRPDKSKNDMLNAWSTQYFYFKKNETLQDIQDRTLRKLGLNPNLPESKTHYNKLIDQMLGDCTNQTKQRSRHMKENRIYGESLRYSLDTLGVDTKYLKNKIAKITGFRGQGGHENPKFPSGENLQTLRGRVIGTVVSDGQVRGSKGLVYYEVSKERIDRFEKTLQEFGDIQLKRKFRASRGTYELYINSAMAEAVSFWGVPEGDRTILNYGLPSDVRNWSKKSQSALIQDMLSQEGCISENGDISWNRRHALCAGNKSQKYGFKSKISPQAVQFLKDSKDANRDHEKGNAGEIYLTIGQLERFQNGSDKLKANMATEILNAVSGNRNRLIDDEADIVRGLGIKVKARPMQVSYYKRSGRVSVRWEARIRDRDSKMMCAYLIRPNDAEKARTLDSWVSTQNQDDVNRTLKSLEQRGL